ncbi:MAG: hypothetical protein GVY10_00905 [Verrucomicrobia bacterium]|jgi:hypothetical protein|nr:hypothetical protein [Verrucomicrobiota bacterium]
MAFILLLLVSLVGLTRVETQSAANNLAVTKARANAVLGMQIALGELQKHAGPDQRVTAPATTVFPTKDLSDVSGDLFQIFRDNSSHPHDTFLIPADRENFEDALRNWWTGKHPRWTGVFDASLRRDSEVDSDRYGEFDRTQPARWLISGNEGKQPGDAGYLTPEDIGGQLVGDPESDPQLVWLVGEGSATGADESVDGLDGRVKVRVQPIASGGAGSGYAYWVADESQKANLGVRDPFFNETNLESVEYRNRLLVPQRIGWERIDGFDEVFENSSINVNDPDFLKLVSVPQIGIIDQAFVDKDGDPTTRDGSLYKNFHHLTSHSRSLHTNTALGGLKKDLTVYFEGSGGPNDSSPIPDRGRYASNDPRFGGSNAGFPASANQDGLPKWGALKDWHDSEASTGASTLPPQRGRAPIYSNYQFFMGFTHKNGRIQLHILPMVTLWNPFDVTLSSTTYTLKFRHNFKLWNLGFATQGITDATPGDNSDGLNPPASTDYLVHAATGEDWYSSASGDFKDYGTILDGRNPWNSSSSSPPDLHLAPFDVAARRADELPPDLDNPNVTFVNYTINTSFEPGEVKTFLIGTSQQVDPSDVHNELETIQMVDSQGIPQDFPGSFYFDVASLVPNGGQSPQATDNVVWYSERLPFENTAMALYAGGDLLWFNPDLGSPGNWINHLTKLSGGDIDPQNPANWRTLQHLDDWFGEPKNLNARNPDAPIIPVHRGRLSPLVTKFWQIFQNGSFRQDALVNSHRAFSIFNLNADSLSPHPRLDGQRNKFAINNSDEYQTLAFVEAEVSDPDQDAMPWFDEQYDPTTGRGFSLTNWQQLDTQRNEVGLSAIPIRKVRRASARVLSLGQLQQANLAKKVWQPSFVIGNAEASPYVDRARAAGIESYQVGGPNSRPPQTFPNNSENDFLDLSYVLNESLWDEYFLSSVPQSGNVALDNSEPLDNSRHRFSVRPDTTVAEVRSFETAAAHIENVGALNVNSTSVEAWKALLTAFRDLKIQGNNGETNDDNTVPVSRTLDPETGPVTYTFDEVDKVEIGAAVAPTSNGRDYSQLFTGFRYMTDEMIETLARRIVDEVRLRGPFYSIADFVNRRLVEPHDIEGAWRVAREKNQQASTTNFTHDILDQDYDPLVGLAGINGAFQRAINLSGINGGPAYPAPDNKNDRVFDVEQIPGELAQDNRSLVKYGAAAFYLDTEHMAGAPAGEGGQLFSHAPGLISQGDLLSMIGPALTARGDTFVIRSYGQSTNGVSNEPVGRAWLETVVQRVAEPVTPSAAAPTSEQFWEPADDFGRRFRIVSIRWISFEDI